ncbi:MAG: two-component regulator propeller domain-containing protein [Elusimicrobiota bacterium]
MTLFRTRIGSTRGSALSMPATARGLAISALAAGAVLAFAGAASAASVPLNYTSGANVTSLIDDGSHLWVGTYGGVTRLDKTTGEMTRYDAANSGLPDNMVAGLAKDINGDLWIGTDNGLARFDGSDWTVYDSGNSPMPRNDVTCLAVEADGTKWIGVFMGGLFKFDGTDWTVYNKSNSGLPEEYFRSMVIDADGNKWLATNGGGLAKFDGTNWTVYNTANSGLPNDRVDSLAIDIDGSLWMNSGGLTHFDGSNWTHYHPGNSPLPHTAVRSIDVASDGTKWIGTYKGLVTFDGSTWTRYDTDHLGMAATDGWTLPDRDVWTVLVDAAGVKWLGFYGGLASYDGADWSVYNVGTSSLPDNYVTSIDIDAQGAKWFGTWGGGLAKLDGSGWSVYNSLNSGIPDVGNVTWVLDTDIDGSVWMRVGSDLVLFEGADWTIYGSGGLGYFRDLVVDPNGVKWILMSDDAGGKLVRYDDVNVSVHPISDSGLYYSYTAYLAADAGGAWIGLPPSSFWDGSQYVPVPGGLARFDGAAWTTYDLLDAGLQSEAVYGLAADDAGGVWVSLRPAWVLDGDEWIEVGGGIAKFDGTDWTAYDSSNAPLPNHSITDLSVDPNGNLWGFSSDWETNTNHLVTFDGTQWGSFILGKGQVPNRRMNAYAVDGDGGLWVATWGGVGYSTLAPPTVDDLDEMVEELDLPGTVESSLAAKTGSALASLEKGRKNAAANQLNAFINQVKAQRGKKIAEEDAAELIATAQEVIAGILE